MDWEIDFYPVGSGRSGDAITFRYYDVSGAPHVILVDGGFQEDGNAIVRHVLTWYGTDQVDHVVCTHPHADHMGGLPTIIAKLRVKKLWVHVPHIHAEAILPLFRNSLLTLDGLRTTLRREYRAIEDLVELAISRGTERWSPFQAAQIGPFTVMSPSTSMYGKLLALFEDTPVPGK